MVHCVPHQVRQGLGERVQDALVHFRVLPSHLQHNLPAALPGEVTNQSWETSEKLFYGHHSYLHRRPLQIMQYPVLKRHRVRKMIAQRVFREARGKFIHCLLQHGFANDQFADQIQDLINTFRVHPQSIFRLPNERRKLPAGPSITSDIGAGLVFCHSFRRFFGVDVRHNRYPASHRRNTALVCDLFPDLFTAGYKFQPRGIANSFRRMTRQNLAGLFQGRPD